MPTRLAVDIGNSRISVGVFTQRELKDSWHIPLNDKEQAFAQIERVLSEHDGATLAVSSVVPAMETQLVESIVASGRQAFTVRSNTQNLVKGTYEGMGTDRIANAAAALKLYVNGNAAIVLDLGTATTLTAVEPSGKFAGGLISLGLGTTFAALHAATDQLPSVNFAASGLSGELAFDTTNAITNGCVSGHLGMLERWVTSAKRQLGADATVIATGGLCETLLSQAPFIDQINRNLTLYGVFFIAEAAADLADRV
jgi:type III pantothenate kinase